MSHGVPGGPHDGGPAPAASSLLAEMDREFGLGLPAGGAERRGAARRGCIAPVVLVPGDAGGRLDEGGRRDGIAVDVSVDGIRVISRSLGPAPFLEVRMPRADGTWIAVRGTVVRCRDLARGYREFGVALAPSGGATT